MISFPSIHELVEPLEVGGIIARDGFSFQDHVAARFCLEMLSKEKLIEVRCESQDDVTLLWSEANIETAEFVQVKGHQLDQFWSIAKLCEKAKKTSSTGNSLTASREYSILEKSLANDRFTETSRFRIVTRVDVNNDLEYLKYPVNSLSRDSASRNCKVLLQDLQARLPQVKSPKGNDIIYWITNTKWDVAHSTDTLQESNLSELRRYVETKNVYLITSKIYELYLKILARVQEAACADWRTKHDSKKIKQNEFRQWLEYAIQEIKESAISHLSQTLKEKMEDAKMPADNITTAIYLMERYREECLSPKYFEPSNRQFAELELFAELNELRAKYDAGQLANSNIEFHEACLSRIRDLQSQLPFEPKPALSLLQGCMYFIAGRCGHRFRRLGNEIISEI